MAAKKTMVGTVDPAVLEYTAGKDVTLDIGLVEVDCIGTAAHVAMLAELPVESIRFTPQERDAITAELVAIIHTSRAGKFEITAEDQDVHLAVERRLTAALGSLGKRVHTARSRNDQVALDLRLFAKGALLQLMEEICGLARVFVTLAQRYKRMPMVGRTHLQPAMPSSVALWATAHAESLLDDLELVQAAYHTNDRSPLGSAAGYGVPLPIDRQLTSDLLDFERPIHNVLYASNARGKCESVILDACAQVMSTLSRLAEDVVLYTMPEFGYFVLPREYCTGSSIMPQKMLAVYVNSNGATMLISPQMFLKKFMDFTTGVLHGQQHHAAEEQPRRLRADAGPRGQGDGLPRLVGHYSQGPGWGLQPRSAGSQGALHGRAGGHPG